MPLLSVILTLRSVPPALRSARRTLLFAKTRLWSVSEVLRRLETKNALVGEPGQGVSQASYMTSDLVGIDFLAGFLEEDTHF